MYYLNDYAEQLSLQDQLPDAKIITREDRILIDLDDYRLDFYGWPDNRVIFSDKITGQNTIKRFGYRATKNCENYYLDCLEIIGVDTGVFRNVD